MEHAVWQTEGGLDFSLFLTLSWMPFHTVRGAAFSQASQGRSCWVLGSIIHQWAWPMLLESSHIPSATCSFSIQLCV